MSDDGAPLITCIIPTYRRPRKLRRAIYSVLNQTFKDVLVCVYDNASGDETEDVVAEIMRYDPRVRYHRHPTNIGAPRNFQYGLERVRTPFFSFLSDDDVLLPEFYGMAMEAFSSRRDAGFVATQVITMTEDGDPRGRPPDHFPPRVYEPPSGFEAMVKYGHPIWTGMLFNSSVLRTCGLLDLSVGSPFDLEFELRIAARHPFIVLDRPGAIFVADEGASATGAYAVATPEGRMKMYQKVTEYPIPEELKRYALRVLRHRHRKGLQYYGKRCLLEGDAEGISKVAKVMSSLYGVSMVSLFFSVMGMLYRFTPLRCLTAKGAKRILSIIKKIRSKTNSLPPYFYDEYKKYLRIPC